MSHDPFNYSKRPCPSCKRDTAVVLHHTEIIGGVKHSLTGCHRCIPEQIAQLNVHHTFFSNPIPPPF